MGDTVELLSRQSNFAVVKLSERAFPGVVVQGDTLHNWMRQLEAIAKHLNAGPTDEDDPITDITHQPAKTDHDAFKTEAKNMTSHGGPKINSPGKISKLLWDLDSRESASQIYDQLKLIDKELGVEIQRNKVNSREFIIAAFSDARLFELVKKLAAGMSSPLWNVVALKPPRGFSFTIGDGGSAMRANDLRFLVDHSQDGGSNVTLLLPKEAGANVTSELAWLILETGIGEELSSKISKLTIEYNNDELRGFPIGHLAARIVS
jgi:hypothetical protein